MTIRTTLMAGTACVLMAMSGQAMAQATHPVTGEALAEVQSFTYRVLDDFPSLDPGLIEDVSGSEVARDLFEGLMNQDADGNLVPGVATGYDVSDDKLTYTFHLRPEAMWSNGEPVVAGDFVYAWRRAASPALASEYQWYMGLMGIVNVDAVIAGEMPIEELGVEAADDHTLVVHLNEPLPYFAQMVTHATTFPVPAATIAEFGDQWTQPEHMVSNGAYTLQSYTPQEELTRVRNEHYWDNEHTIIDTVTALIINDESAALTRYLAGELDRTEVPAGQYPRLHEEYPDQAISFPNLCTYYYNVNLTASGLEALQDVRVREALSMAIDRDIIVDNVLAGGQRPAYTLTHWATAGFEVPAVPAAAMTQGERNAAAVALLAEAGYGPDGEPLTLEIIYNTSDAHQAVAVAISQMWKQTLGVETTLANQEWATFLDVRGEQAYPALARAAWCADYNEASSFLDIMQSNSGYNDSKYANPAYDALLAEARTAEDPLPLYSQAEELLVVDVPIFPIYHYASVYMLNDHLENWPVNNAQQNWYAKDLYISAE